MPERSGLLPGDIVVVPFPYTDLSSAKMRPALVLSNEAYNASGQDIVLCGMTSNLADAAFSVTVGPQDMESGRLMAPSRVKVGRIMTVDRAIVRKRVGRLNAKAFSRVMREFEAVFL